MKLKLPDLPYYVEHGLIALGITLIALLIPNFALISAGFFFYLGREIRDLEKLHNWNMEGFDWPGMLWPVYVTIGLWILTFIF